MSSNELEKTFSNSMVMRFNPSDLQESFGDALSKGSVTGSYGAAAIPEDRAKPNKNWHLMSGGVHFV